ncbi:aminoglycoside phosphotransferase family protein [Cryobacterium sp. PH31-AA6]|uniref:aminoglycoside phosphotransferase family protein n=1 Tax=Cryobacterium sp. PH31-AA6 TaxID=3046205 RepID=UPI0024BA9C44|nr:aminoglycoside phosphotransferase family protein [Cryobacterium sp. PH31-AA6]MDJ0323050.1 aminoglycoside phosphotransferase family protein [Cryobacterium sp. PH31-AA6]
MDEEALTGGNSNSVVRVGDTVRRPAGPWTPAVNRFLTALRDAGIVEVPEPLGLDQHGREVLSFLPGEVGNHPMRAWMWSPAILQEAGALLRRVHDASVPIVHLPGHWQLPTHHPVEVVCLNDVAPYNMVFQAGHLTGLIDFDTASPGPRIWDLAYLAYRLVPLGEYADDHSPGADARTDRLEALIRAYGHPFEPDAVLRVAAERLDDLAEFTDRRAADTGRAAFIRHAALYRRDRDLLRGLVPNGL